MPRQWETGSHECELGWADVLSSAALQVLGSQLASLSTTTGDVGEQHDCCKRLALSLLHSMISGINKSMHLSQRDAGQVGACWNVVHHCTDMWHRVL